MDCKRVGEVIFLFFDGEMEDDLRTPFQRHVETCSHCAQQIDYTRKLLLLFRQGCSRCSAPRRLRRRILISLPHRRDLH
jgi:mycothiol system anti-sigma-R factor